MVEVAGLEPASKNSSSRGRYMLVHIRGSGACEDFVPSTNPGEFLARSPGFLVGLIFSSPPWRLYLLFVIGAGPSAS